MARIEVTEESLRATVDEPVFRHALDLTDKVSGLSATGLLVEAVVDGSAVSVRIRPDSSQPDSSQPDSSPLDSIRPDTSLHARCACPAPPPCAHALAAALAWVHAASQDDDQEADLPGLRADFDDVLDELADEAIACEPGDEWYPDTDDLEELLDELEDLADQTPDAVADLTAHVIERIKSVLNAGKHQGDDLSEALTRAEALAAS